MPSANTASARLPWTRPVVAVLSTAQARNGLVPTNAEGLGKGS